MVLALSKGSEHPKKLKILNIFLLPVGLCVCWRPRSLLYNTFNKNVGRGVTVCTAHIRKGVPQEVQKSYKGLGSEHF